MARGGEFPYSAYSTIVVTRAIVKISDIEVGELPFRPILGT